jgi:hypothetical protein
LKIKRIFNNSKIEIKDKINIQFNRVENSFDLLKLFDGKFMHKNIKLRRLTAVSRNVSTGYQKWKVFFN